MTVLYIFAAWLCVDGICVCGCLLLLGDEI
jgi:hypothetical protein